MNACMSGRVGVCCKFVPVYRSTGTSGLDPCARKSLSRRHKRAFSDHGLGQGQSIDYQFLYSTSIWVGSLVDWMWHVLKDLILIYAWGNKGWGCRSVLHPEFAHPTTGLIPELIAEHHLRVQAGTEQGVHADV